ncbi:MmgE/PrpD family protein [Shinella sp.]|uniref:MmgE/PrpD family protein n=1 Tax=Shinella sp. TaxID=1870904 RepID=UPI003F70E977
MTSLLPEIARRLSLRTTFSETAIEHARDAVIDTLGCMIAGAHDSAVQAVVDAFRDELSSGGDCWLVTGGAAPSSLAALVNGTAAHALDFDDNFHPARAHASAVLVPALLAVAGAAVSGRHFLEAYLTGLEAQAAVGFGVNPSHYNRGWHGTSTVGTIGAAAGVARLLGAGIEQTAQAMSLATSMACGPKGQFGTPAKPLHAGIAARNAVEAARLALAGSAGRLDILERPQGFLDLFGGDEPRGWSDWPMEDAHIIETRGLVTKRHPCCASTHRAIDALLDLKREHGLTAADIVRIETKVGLSAVRNLVYREPENGMQARFSMHYCLATALVNDGLSLKDFEPSALHRPQIQALMSRIEMTSYTAEEERGHERLPHLVTVTLKNGTVLHHARLHAKGSREDALDADQRRRKFADCLEWGGYRADNRLYDRLLALPSLSSMNEALPAM